MIKYIKELKNDFMCWNANRNHCIPLQKIVDVLPSGVLVVDDKATITHVNNRLANMFNYSAEELVGQKVEMLMEEKYRDSHIAIRNNYIKSNKEVDTPYLMSERTVFHGMKSSGEVFPVEIMLNKFKWKHNTYVIVTVNDVSERINQEQEIKQLAYRDSLTNLPNRLYVNKLGKKMYSDFVDHGHGYTVMLIDVDNFKVINDTLGHSGGDYALKKIAFILQKNVQVFSNGIAARLGGDEFVIILYTTDQDEVDSFIHKLFEDFEEPTMLENGHMYNLKISVGVSQTSAGTKMVNILSNMLRAADIALYESKRLGKNRYSYYTHNMDQELSQKSKNAEILRYFINTKNFDIYYQPIFDIKSNRIVAVEALFRSSPFFRLDKNPGLLQTAEELGLMSPLGEAITEKAVEACKGLIKDYPDFMVGINVSVSEIEKDNYVPRLHAIVEAGEVPPENIILEITESVLMTQLLSSSFKMKSLQRIGFSNAIDDFGVGFSSMSYLSRLPIDKLKIDKEFIDRLDEEKTKEIVRGIVNIAHNLGIIVVAEGVETLRQMEQLEEMGVEQIQGFLVSPAMPYDALIEFLKDRREMAITPEMREIVQ